jgi:hypothetical protein
MRRLQLTVGAGYLTGFYSFKHAAPVFARRHASKTAEYRDSRFLPSIFWMVVLAVRVGLPQFNHGIRDRQSIAIEHAADHGHALSLYIFAGNARDRSLVSEA